MVGWMELVRVVAKHGKSNNGPNRSYESIDAHSNDTQNDEQAHVNDHPMTANEKSTGQPSTNESTHISTADSVRQSSAMFKSSSALSRDGGAAKCKRMRTTFRNSQLKAMRLHFNQNQNPDGLELRRLSARTGLSKRVLQVWFQNARAKWRRHFFRQKCVGPQIVRPEVKFELPHFTTCLELEGGDKTDHDDRTGRPRIATDDNEKAAAADHNHNHNHSPTWNDDFCVKRERNESNESEHFEATILQFEQPFWTNLTAQLIHV